MIYLMHIVNDYQREGGLYENEFYKKNLISFL